ncbi:hypothetical protein CFC21_085010 [Triticum aestivum]|uniref:MADS-box domain-containing protein n=3 Tax=Triticum TaxID=4564 RepID=A0A3B6NVN4_WHEAT|nr:agamous-like MADS-box protein AGL80 [Triticum dicoccoides]XP_044406857.1 agamous-like MADS-box protein AGL80 [Triticum aestivum]XP_048534667.1 agamous-like MADS-box protein AGL80 [Triticum urartu]KAF7081026.1 hypothetical protein CFC21_085010 [Triticum aestivum]
MARKKVTLQYIANDSTRRGTFKKRLRGLMKKAGELAILCDVKTCVLVYGEGEPAPEVFPSHAKAAAILTRFRSMPELGQCKNKMNQAGFLTQRIDKLRDQVDKSRRECRDREIKVLLHRAMLGALPGLAGLTIEELTSVGWKVDVLLRSIGERIDKIHSLSMQAPPPAAYQLTTGSSSMEDHMGSPPSLYQVQAPPQQQQQEGWLDMVPRPGEDLGTQLLYGGYTTGGHDGASFSSSSGDMNMMMMQPFDLGFGLSHFPPM